ncbi:MAG: hypothetical protein GF364_10820 [Candidatus Lokiarchaeota archaeon]|nr:hypothetical protein [Candidatus Lokiarchaeota archaeon]
MNIKNLRLKLTVLFCALVFISSIKPVLASNDYCVCEGASFRWDADKYFYRKDGLGVGNDLIVEDSYYFAFDFTNFADSPGGEYLNGTYDNNGTDSGTGEISHMKYYTPQDSSNYWVTDIIDYQGDYIVGVYVVCTIEIDSTRNQLQALEDDKWFTLTEPTPNNFTLTGTCIEGSSKWEYKAYIEFNEDKVLKYVYDELKTYALDGSWVLSEHEKYVWSLTYTAGTGTCGGGCGNDNGGGNGDVPGFPLWAMTAAIMVGFIFLLRKKRIRYV